MTFNKAKTHQFVKGFSLIESLIATLLFALSCLGIFSLYQQQIEVTQSLELWHDAKELASGKASDLHKQVINSHTAVADLVDDSGGELAAGQLTITKNGRRYNMQRHWQVTTVRPGAEAFKLVTISVSLSANKLKGAVIKRIILLQPDTRVSLRADDINPDGG